MKLKFIIPALFIALLFSACSEDDTTNDTPTFNELTGLNKVQDLTNSTHTIELYNATGRFYTGYNEISLRIKDNATNSYVKNAAITWMPVMQMPTMQHSCPKTNPVKALGKETVYTGNIVYQMAFTDGSGWSLTVNYTINGMDYTVTAPITVMQSSKQNVASVLGSDNKRYVVAMIAPKNPIIGNNELVVGLYQMENMMTFSEVPDYSLTLDPRMPGMGNHSSPNNTSLVFNSADKQYYANLSLTMTGYWVLNLQLLDSEGNVLKGEPVTLENTQSSLYLELEF
ncbi:hypothetical protein ACFSQP_02095 [Bizionia sediminis]|uniref:YtkA-like domain-containing protein n=1 Tax=Bizionia sediminis TaxID=1737064 RepID=A0ABW5KQ61_9FLAO